MVDVNSDVGLIHDLLQNFIQLKDTDEISKLTKYSIMERLMIMLFFYFRKNRIGSQVFQLKSIFNIYKEHTNTSDSGDSEVKLISSDLNKLFISETADKLKDIRCLSLYAKYFNL